MKFTVDFEHNWEMKDLEKWKEDNQGERFDDHDRSDLMEISFFANLTERYPDVPVLVLEEVAKTALEEAFERGFDDIVDRWISYKTIGYDIQDKIKRGNNK